MLIGGNSFGLMAPVVTGYVIQITGSYNGAFAIGGLLLIVGAVISFTMTRKPIITIQEPTATASPAMSVAD